MIIINFKIKMVILSIKILYGVTVIQEKYMGRSGYGDQNAWASHLHYELRINGVIVNPVDENGNLIDPQLFLNKEKPINGGMLEKIVIEVAKFINIE